MRKLKNALALALLPAALLALSACTGTPAPTFNTAKPNAACLLGAPQVKTTTVKRGTNIAFNSPGGACKLKYTDNGSLVISLAPAKNGRNVVGSILVKASPEGKYAGKVYVPALATPGDYTLSVAGGAQQKCAGGANCPAPVTPIKVTK